MELQDVSKRHGATAAVGGVSFAVARGTLVTLLGPSRCGKTTTPRLLAGLEHPTGGRIPIGGEDVTRRSATERDVSMAFQSYAPFPHVTVLENACYGPRAAGLKRSDRGRGASGAGRRRPVRLRRAPALGTLRRPAAARGRGARRRAGVRGAAVRRAALQPRRRTAPAGPQAPGSGPADAGAKVAATKARMEHSASARRSLPARDRTGASLHPRRDRVRAGERPRREGARPGGFNPRRRPRPSRRARRPP